MLIGHRNKRQDGWSRILVTKVLKLVVKICFGTTITDANTPFRLMKASVLREALPLVPKDFNLSNVILSVIFAKQQRRIRYMPITFRPRQGGVKYFFLGYFQGRKISVGKWFLLGWAFMSVALLRVNMAVPFLFFPPLIWLKEILAGKGRWVIRPVLSFAAGFSLLGALVAYWLWQGNALTACLADYIQFNLAYSADPERASLKNKIKSLTHFAKQPVILLSLVVMADRSLLTVKKWCSFDCLYTLYIILALLAICISGQQYGHYGMVLIPCTVYPLVLLLKGAVATISRQRLRIWLSLLTASLILTAAMPLEEQLHGYYKTGYNLMDVRADKDCADLLNEIDKRTEEWDRISVFGNDNIIYVASHRLPAGVYSYQFPIADVDNRIGENYFADLQNNRPKIIVVVKQTATAPIFSRWSKKMVDFLQTECYKEVYGNGKYIIYEQQGSGEIDGKGI